MRIWILHYRFPSTSSFDRNPIEVMRIASWSKSDWSDENSVCFFGFGLVGWCKFQLTSQPIVVIGVKWFWRVKIYFDSSATSFDEKAASLHTNSLLHFRQTSLVCDLIKIEVTMTPSEQSSDSQCQTLFLLTSSRYVVRVCLLAATKIGIGFI